MKKTFIKMNEGMKEIIQHHDVMDLKAFYDKVKAGYVGIDYHDFEMLMMKEGEKHSFIGEAEGSDRLKYAFEGIMAADDARSIIAHATDIMITVVKSPESSHPLSIEEMKYLNTFIDNLSESVDVMWGITEESGLGDKVRVILIAVLPQIR